MNNSDYDEDTYAESWVSFLLEHSIFDFQSKLGCTSKIKINTNLFGILLGLDKFLTLKNENTFSFSLLNRNFALTLKRYSALYHALYGMNIPRVEEEQLMSDV